MSARLRVMAEYGSSGVWGVPSERRGAFRHGAVVHLTWKRAVEEPLWPSTDVFPTWADALAVLADE